MTFATPDRREEQRSPAGRAPQTGSKGRNCEARPVGGRFNVWKTLALTAWALSNRSLLGPKPRTESDRSASGNSARATGSSGRLSHATAGAGV
eukprot:7775233-Alexandrium_andersonii.AAC.1